MPLLRDAVIDGATGAGLTVGIWDAGAVRTTHQEFSAGNRVSSIDGGAPHDHSTHVAGTIGAAGVNADAKGMAPAVLIKSYNWDNDDAEMLGAAAATANDPTKILISNHSYGYGRGWEFENQGNGDKWTWHGGINVPEDAAFGAYNDFARAWDAICYDAPYYLPFAAAGNDREDGPSTGNSIYFPAANGGWTVTTYNPTIHPATELSLQYDTVADYAAAKNVMVVGSVTDAVANAARSLSAASASSFSDWGGADDGRIKPDIVANGHDLYSPISSNGNNKYGFASGTSMATPGAAGTAILLQDLYKKKNGSQAMRASKLKALMLHTADDLGRPGPDYSFGWGLVNAKAAANVIVQQNTTPASNSLVDATLTSGGTLQYHYQSAGGQHLRFTIAWTDVEGAAHTGLDDRSAVLVNDLDLRVQSPSGTTLQPFKLDVLNPTANAIAGDNLVDPVEQIYIPVAEAGEYVVTVSHKNGALASGSQVFSLVATGQINGVQEPLAPGWVELFHAPARPFDLANVQLTFVPVNGSYHVMKRAGAALPNPVIPAMLVSNTTPTSGNKDDGYWLRSPAWTRAKFFDSPIGSICLGSNGSVAFGNNMVTTPPNDTSFFASRQIAAVCRDLDLRNEGSLYYEFRTGDRLVVTYQNVPEYVASGSGGSNTVQLEIFDDGSDIVRLTYLNNSVTDAIAGFSPGSGVPATMLSGGVDLSISPALPQVTFTAPMPHAEEGVASLEIKASLSQSVPFPITLPLALSGTASADDFFNPLNSLTIPANSVSQSISRVPDDDALTEGDEIATFTAGNGFSYELSANGSVDLRIIDNHYLGGMWAHWPMIETNEANPAVPDGIGGFHGTRQGTLRIDGKHDHALFFDGTDDAVSIPALHLNANRVTISGWIRRDGPVNDIAGLWMTRAGASPGVGLHIASDHTLRYHWADSPSGAAENWNSTLIVPQGRWVFVALAIEPTQATLMMRDGDSLTWEVRDAIHNAEEIDGTSYLGWDPASPTRRFHGAMDDWRIQKRALSPADFDLLFHDSLNAWELYALDDGVPASDIGPAADPDGDGIPNLIEFALHASPKNTTPPPVAMTQVGDGSWRFHFPPSLEPSVILGLEWSQDLANWQSTGMTLTPDGWMIDAAPASVFVRLRGTP